MIHSSVEDPDISPDLLTHDLRAAAAGVISSLALMRPEELSRENAFSLRQAMASAATLQDLLDIAMGATRGTPISIELRSLAARIKDRWHNTSAQKGVALVVDTTKTDHSHIRVSVADLHRMIDNLLGNAIKYCEQGSILVQFSTNGAGRLVISVEDDGPGFSSAALSSLFELRGRPTDSTKDGTGLGLFITKSLADRMGAEISVENREKSGARINIVLPAELSWRDTDANAANSGATKADQKLPDLSSLNILVAEDNVTNQMVVGHMLDALGAKYTLTSDGAEAMAVLTKQPFDLALLDIEMPRMSGLDVIRTVRGLSDARAKMPLLALTAYAMPEHVRQIEAAGATGLIAKPLTSVADFGNAILAHLNGAATRKSAANAPTINIPEIGNIDRDIYNALAETLGAESMRELLEKFTADLQSVAKNLSLSIESERPDFARGATHILISLAGAIGAVNLQMLAQKVNGQLNANEWRSVLSDIQVLLQGLDALLGFVATEMDNW